MSLPPERRRVVMDAPVERRAVLTRPSRAQLGYAAGLALLSCGLYLTLGLGWSLVAAGAGVMVAAVLLYDVDAPSPSQAASTDDEFPAVWR